MINNTFSSVFQFVLSQLAAFMRKLSLVCVFAFTLTAFSQTQIVPNASKNYIHSITYKQGYTVPALGSALSGEKIETISYFDGLGRPIQSVAVRQGGKDNLAVETDLYTHTQYDAYGREVKKYLPLPATQNDGRFITDPVTAINSYYLANYAGEISTTTPNPYAETRFEASPLNRVLEQGAPGTVWAVNPAADTDHTIKFDYQTNALNEVLRYDVSLAADYTPTLIANGSYPAGTLYKTVTKDENWTSGNDRTTQEFKDLQGRVVLKRTYNANVAHDTYYIYDDYGNLTYVLPPKVVTTDGVSAGELAELCYQYKYDGRNRLIEKKIPGKGWEYIVYNKLDQPIMTQDANLQAQSQWLFTKYDAFGRVVYTGLIGTVSSRATLQTAADAAATQFENRVAAYALAGTTVYYSNTAYPTAGITELHTLNYYDDYAFDTDGGVSETAYGVTPITTVKGLPTGSKVRVLGTSNWTTTVTYYDDKARPVYVYSHNTYLNATDKLKTKLDFIGKPLETSSVHTKDGLFD